LIQAANIPGLKTGFRILWRVALIALGTVLVAGVIAPFINAQRFSAPIHRALESSLGRKVEFGAVHFTLFSGPGFSLENVTIGEDPGYGLEPFAYVPTLQARVRFDKLIFGAMRFSSLRLVDPSLNLVKRSDGAWNVVPLVERLSTPRRAPLSFFPAFVVANGRIDFKLGTRKTTLYLLETDLSIYPERSGKLYIQFSGSPARTDRAGNGFGHLRGTANWYVNPANAQANQLEADVTLDPSNLSELTALFQGHDIGVHGTVSSRARIEGPSAALRISGELRLQDVHRWDLLPSTESSRGQEGRIRYRGDIDWVSHKLNVETLPWRAGDPTPLALELRADDFLTHPLWSVLTHLDKAPVEDLLPLAKRMGLAIPQYLGVTGSVDGTLGYSNSSGLTGDFAIRDATATLPNIPPLHAAILSAKVNGDRVHFNPAMLDAPTGALQASGDFYLLGPTVIASLSAQDFPLNTLKGAIDAWFGAPSALGILNGGDITGELSYRRDGPTRGEVTPAVWSGQLDFVNATLNPPGLAFPLDHSEGRVSFDDSTLDLSRFSGALGQQTISASFHYNVASTHPARLRVELPSADLTDIEAALAPTLQDQSLFGRFRVARRVVPSWLATREVEGDLVIRDFSVGQTKLGALSTRFLWQGTSVQLSALQLKLPEGRLQGHGAVSLASYLPHYRFSAKVNAFPWRGGFLNADGEFDTAGMGADTLQHLRADGAFSGQDLNLSADDAFTRVAGLFDFSFAGGWPDLKLSKLQVEDGEDAWNGQAASQSDGKLILDLEHAGRQRRIISTLAPELPADVSWRLPLTRAEETDEGCREAAGSGTSPLTCGFKGQ